VSLALTSASSHAGIFHAFNCLIPESEKLNVFEQGVRQWQ
jgi:hypothetical protein